MNNPSISERIEGTKIERMTREFFLNSGLFQIFFLTYIFIADGAKDVLYDPASYVLTVGAFFQTWIIERWGRVSVWKNALFLLITPAAYTLTDVVSEGWFSFEHSLYHIIYWTFSLSLALLTLWRSMQPSLLYTQTVLMSILRTLLFPALYLAVEINSAEGIQVFTGSSFLAYWSAPGHAYILAGSIIFGLLIGISEATNNRSFLHLQVLSKKLHELTGWSFDDAFAEAKIADKPLVCNQRVSKVILFMDIRGFTKWSEAHCLDEIIEMLNFYYETAEQDVLQAGGHKPKFTGDEVMTWFEPSGNLLERLQNLLSVITSQLQIHGLSVGIGVHFGEVVEGFMGSKTSKLVTINGDPVNTAARMCSAALPGELLLSEAACNILSLKTEGHAMREIIAKGKQEPLKVFRF